MAQQIGSGRIARPAAAKQQLLPAATAAGEAAREVLIRHYGQAEWIHQAASAVEQVVQRCIQQLSGSSISGNMVPGDGYRFPARSKQELIETQHLVADARSVGRKEDPQDPAMVLERPAPASPPPQASAAPKGWLL